MRNFTSKGLLFRQFRHYFQSKQEMIDLDYKRVNV